MDICQSIASFSQMSSFAIFKKFVQFFVQMIYAACMETKNHKIPTWGGLPRIFWFLVAGVFLNRLGSFFYLISYYLTQKRNFSDQQAGVAISLYGVGAIIGGPLGGFLADRLGRRTSMILGMVLGALAMLHLGCARMTWHLMLAAFCLGLFGDLYRPAMNAAIADLIPPSERTRAYGWSYWAANLGYAASAFLGGYLVHFGYSWLFAVDAATTLGFAMLILAFIPEIRPLHVPLVVQTTMPTKARSFWQNPYVNYVFLSFLAVQFLLEFLLKQSIVSLSLDMKDHGLSAQYFGYLNGLNAGLIIVLQPIVRRIVRHLQRSWVLALASLLMGVGLGMYAVVLGHLPLTLLSVFLWTTGEIFMFCVIAPVIADLAPAETRGRYQGAYQMITSLAALCAPLYGTFLLQHQKANLLWTSCLGIGLGAAVLHVLIAPARKQHLIEMYGHVEGTHREEGTTK